MPRPLWVHAFLVDGLLIDAGPPHCVAELLNALAAERIDQMVLTHHHEDHVGAALLGHAPDHVALWEPDQGWLFP